MSGWEWRTCGGSLNGEYLEGGLVAHWNVRGCGWVAVYCWNCCPLRAASLDAWAAEAAEFWFERSRRLGAAPSAETRPALWSGPAWPPKGAPEEKVEEGLEEVEREPMMLWPSRGL